MKTGGRWSPATPTGVKQHLPPQPEKPPLQLVILIVVVHAVAGQAHQLDTGQPAVFEDIKARAAARGYEVERLWVADTLRDPETTRVADRR